MRTIITLAGRQFVTAERTSLRQDLSVWAQVQAAGVGTVELSPGESPDAFVERISAAAAQDPSMLRLLAHVLIPIDLGRRRWTPETADEVAAFLYGATGEEDLPELQRQMTALYQGLTNSGAVTIVQRTV